MIYISFINSLSPILIVKFLSIISFNDIKGIIKFPNSTVRTAKQLFSFTRNSLSDYLKFGGA